MRSFAAEQQQQQPKKKLVLRKRPASVLGFGSNAYQPVYNCVTRGGPVQPNGLGRFDWGCPRLFTKNSPVNFNNADGFGLMTSMAFAAASVGLFGALVLSASVLGASQGKPQMIRFSSAILEGMTTYQKNIAKLYAAFAIVFFGTIIGVLYNWVQNACPPYQPGDPQYSTNTCNPYIGTPALDTTGIFTGLCFLVGAVLAGVSSYSATHLATKANVRTAFACSTSTQDGARVALKSGAAISLATSSLALMGLIICLLVLTIGTFDQRLVWQYLVGFGFGASSGSIFVRVAGGLYSKSATLATDLADKLDVAPASSINNPLVVADNVGKLISELSGANLAFFETWIGSIIAACILGFSTYSNLNLTPDVTACLFGTPYVPAWLIQTNYAISSIAYPLWLAGVQIVCVMYALQWVRYAVDDSKSAADQEFYLTWATRGGVWVSSLLYVGLSALISWICFGNSGEEWNLFGCCLIGMAGSWLVGIFHGLGVAKDMYASQTVQDASDKGPSFFIAEGVSIAGLLHLFPLFILVVILIACNAIGGQYGVAIAAISWHAGYAIRLTILTLSPILDTTSKIGELCVADVKPEGVARIDTLSQAVKANVGSVKATGVVASSLAAVVLTFAWVQNTGAHSVDFDDPVVLAGGFIGAFLPFLVVSLQLLPLGPTAEAAFLELQERIKKQPQLRDNAYVGGDHVEAANALSKKLQLNAAMNLVTPLVVLLSTPFVVSFMLGSTAHSATLFAATISATFLALTLGTTSTLLSGAKYQLVKTKAGEAKERAAELGQAILDPLADTIAPLVISFARALAMLSLLLAPVFEMTNFNGTVFNDGSWWIGLLVLGPVLLGLFFVHHLHGNPRKEVIHKNFTNAIAALLK